MIVIQIRGTSGSGKTTVMKQLMKNYRWLEMRIDGRKKPLYYYHNKDIAILGHYESVCGGCDNIGSAGKVYDVIQKIDTAIVLCEGLLLSEDVKWTLKLREEGHIVLPIFLTTPPDECVARVIDRRKEAGNEKEFNTANTLNRVGVIERAYTKLKEAGFTVRKCKSPQAPLIVSALIQSHLEER